MTLYPHCSIILTVCLAGGSNTIYLSFWRAIRLAAQIGGAKNMKLKGRVALV
ncbi:MAG: hypothetical protein ACI906_002813, partial [Candidatus Latescibacterota bacterium]